MRGAGKVRAAVGAPLAAECKDLLLGFDCQQGADLRQNLGICIVELGDRVVRALANTGTAAVALGGDHFCCQTLGVINGSVGAGTGADAAGLAFCAHTAIRPNDGNSWFDLPTIRVQNT